MDRLASTLTILFLALCMLVACGGDEDTGCRYDFEYSTATGMATTQACVEKIPDNVCANLANSSPSASCDEAPYEQCGDSDVWIISPGADVKEEACLDASVAIVVASVQE